jgi:hypothetical protein
MATMMRQATRLVSTGGHPSLAIISRRSFRCSS